MTYGELKNHIKALGFEKTLDNDVLIPSCNRVIELINKTVVARLEQYFKWDWYEKHGGDDDYEEWTMPTPTPIDINTTDDFVIDLPDKVIDLVPLYAAYFIWLDDDISKASFYQNEYDDMKDQIINEALRPRTARINGGVTL